MLVYDIDEELTLRTLDERDAVALFSLIENSREHLREWLPWVDETTTLFDSQQFISSSDVLFKKKIGLNTGIIYNGELVGVAGFNKFDWNNGIGYIGYWLSKDYQGKGIMTRVVQALIDYAFEQLNLNRVDIRVAYENYKSRAIPERLGCRIEGQIRQAEWLYNHYVDHVIYGMLASDWMESRS
ncbi:GNAT family N-acetyltransferase [Ornithinibacillus halophilus]|uniref:Ribosomal-protein-serine acetyltransferase n=1 Tax=Ornithinibacillus halophilus TaxID=930117 RepID=A0A1M5G1D7_9BACI|nr:GNAT family protein [Ornithinibacillus halophilus]SHF97526.1 ribosomal-protein-serine acetyltransferase [Ornithinibacillus halophilus]